MGKGVIGMGIIRMPFWIMEPSCFQCGHTFEEGDIIYMEVHKGYAFCSWNCKEKNDSILKGGEEN